MRLHRFFIEEQLRNKKEISFYDGEIIHQWKDVFRLHSGDRIILLDNSGFEYLSEIQLLAKGKADIKILEQTVVDNFPKNDVWLFAALIKKDNFEWILEKGTELGISHFIPVVSERSEKKNLNIERAEKIVKEASEQSGRGTMPNVHEVLDLDKALMLAEENHLSLIAFHLEGEAFISNNIADRSAVAGRLGIKEDEVSIGILIGPEGGWTENEIKLFKEKEIPIYALGKLVLRAETAAIAVSASLLL